MAEMLRGGAVELVAGWGTRQWALGDADEPSFSISESFSRSGPPRASLRKQPRNLSEIIPPQLSSLSSSASTSATEPSEAELQNFGVSEDLRDFVKGRERWEKRETGERKEREGTEGEERDRRKEEDEGGKKTRA